MLCSFRTTAGAQPTFTGPADLTILCDDPNQPPHTGNISNVQGICSTYADTAFTDILQAGSCVNNYQIMRSWTISDSCGNQSAPYVQTISVMDQGAPAFEQPAVNMQINCSSNTAAESAFQTWLSLHGSAIAEDGCTPQGALQWFAAVPGSYDLNDPLSWPGEPVGNLAPTICPSADSSIYRQEVVDFVVFDECNNATVSSAVFQVIDQTPPQFTHCPNDSILTNDSGLCTADFTLPTTNFADACGSGLTSLAYQIDNAPPQLANPSALPTIRLDVGQHQLTYIATDCAGNEGFCNFQIIVQDENAPQIICPSDTSIWLSPTDNCDEGINIALPSSAGITDNCSFAVFQQTQPTDAATAFLRFSYHNQHQDYIADDKTHTFVGTAADAISPVSLLVRVEGDVEDAEAYFSIFDEEGNMLGTTAAGQPNVSITPGDCNVLPPLPAASEFVLTIAASTYNTWAVDGQVQFFLLSNKQFSAPSPGNMGDGISPICNSFAANTPDGSIDSISNLTLEVSYQRATLKYRVEGVTSIPLTEMLPPAIQPVEIFGAGVSTVSYQVADASGNTQSCSYQIQVLDSLPPSAICTSTTIFVNPSGLVDYVLTASEVDGGSFDNCSLANTTVSPSVFTCQMAGSTQEVSLAAEDGFGNRANCLAEVVIALETPRPDYTIGLCGNDQLSLFANPPFIPAGFDYSYSWTGPAGFASSLADPVIANADFTNSGIYVLHITGLNGCVAIDSVEVIINAMPDQPQIELNAVELCQNDTLLLSTQQYAGNQVRYDWYSGSFPAGTLAGSTNTPGIAIDPPLSNNAYYVIVDVDGCASAASDEVAVNITNAPVASVRDPVIAICEGDSFHLATDVTGAAYSYQWAGPNGFSSSEQYPATVYNSTLADSGAYALVISENGCPSNPATAVVSVNRRPIMPTLFTEGLACQGASLTLSTNMLNADFYSWYSPEPDTQFTGSNQLMLFNVDSLAVGAWQVVATQNGCSSSPSMPVEVFVEPLPIATATNTGPACEGVQVELLANLLPGATYLWSGPNDYVAMGSQVLAPAVAGVYSLTVTNSVGCTNVAITQVLVNEAPEITAISSNASACVDGSEQIRLIATLFPPDDGRYLYQWSGPNNFMSADRFAILPSGTSTDNGLYTLVVVNEEGCSSLMQSIWIELQDRPTPPEIDGPSVVCNGQTLVLCTDSLPGNAVSYHWQTPLGNITSNSPCLTIPNSSVVHTGNYQLTVEVQGCTSEPSQPLMVSVTNSLPPPQLSSNSPLCEGATIELSTPSIPGASYLWTGPNGFSDTLPNPVIENATQANGGNYSVQLTLNGCVSPFSMPLQVIVDSLPLKPSISSSGAVCISRPGAQLQLMIVPGTETAGASYSWYNAQSNLLVGGPTFSTSLLLNNFSNYQQGSHGFYAFANNNGCISEPSEPVLVQMDTIPSLTAFAGDDQFVCDDGITFLNASTAVTGSGLWTQIGGLPASLADSTWADTEVSGLQAGNMYAFAWSLSNGACVNYSTDSISLQVFDTDVAAEAGADFTACGNGSAILMALPPPDGASASWSTATAGLTFDDPNSAEALVSGLGNGMYSLVWTVDLEDCGQFSDTVLISYVLGPIAENDTLNIVAGGPNQLDVVINDQLFGNAFTVKLVDEPALGAVNYLGGGNFSYQPAINFSGFDQFRYRLCSQICPDVCTEASVWVYVNEASDCEPSTIFSPNNDGINDTFSIPCLQTDRFPRSTVSIFNQWGDELFRESPYRNDWAGTYEGTDLPAGTYYFVVDFGNGLPSKAGFLILER